MVTFGKQLSEFAPYFNRYYEKIKGIDGGVVEASSNAALDLAEMAAKLPMTCGLAQFFAEKWTWPHSVTNLLCRQKHG
jgi:hypothetical protein